MKSQTISSFSAVVLAAALAVSEPAVAAAAAARSGVAWQYVSSDVEVDKAFALGRRTGKPIFLYWGAVWCPPCNQVKATLFSRSDFVERSQAFIPVYVDGDKPGAQKVAARFKVTGYPTMVLFKPDGTEITRLPGEVDPQRYLLTLTAGMEADLPVKELLRKALLKQPLSAAQWKLLAYYSWDTDEQQVLSTQELPKKLSDLSALAPPDLVEVRERFGLKALISFARGKPDTPMSLVETEAGLALVEQIIADKSSVRRHSDIFVNYGNLLVERLTRPGESRKGLAKRFDLALGYIAQDSTLSHLDQIDVLGTRIGLWKAADGSDNLVEAQKSQVLRQVAQVVSATTDRYERQAVVPGAAHALSTAGLLQESDELLRRELGKAVAPYYHMLGLAGNAKRRNDSKGALDWYEQAWKKSEGSATRIQWGTSYVGQAIDLAPTEIKRIQAGATAVIAELEPKGETFYERNQRSLSRMATRLVKWQGSEPARVLAVEKIKGQVHNICQRLKAGDVSRANCNAVLNSFFTRS
ncbi:MAG: thioredoxin family protein [Pseudomonadota bacterium]